MTIRSCRYERFSSTTPFFLWLQQIAYSGFYHILDILDTKAHWDTLTCPVFCLCQNILCLIILWWLFSDLLTTFCNFQPGLVDINMHTVVQLMGHFQMQQVCFFVNQLGPWLNCCLANVTANCRAAVPYTTVLTHAQEEDVDHATITNRDDPWDD